MRTICHTNKTKRQAASMSRFVVEEHNLPSISLGTSIGVGGRHFQNNELLERIYEHWSKAPFSFQFTRMIYRNNPHAM
jgi:hypothetical protein